MEDFLKAIGNVGFPIAVAAYLLVRIETKMDNLASLFLILIFAY